MPGNRMRALCAQAPKIDHKIVKYGTRAGSPTSPCTRIFSSAAARSAAESHRLRIEPGLCNPDSPSEPATRLPVNLSHHHDPASRRSPARRRSGSRGTARAITDRLQKQLLRARTRHGIGVAVADDHEAHLAAWGPRFPGRPRPWAASSVSLIGSPHAPRGRAVPLHRLPHQVHRLHHFEHPHVEAVPAIAQHGLARHRRIVVILADSGRPSAAITSNA